MSTLLVVFLVMSTSATRPRASENQPDDFIFDHVDDDYGIQTDQEILEEQLDISAESR